VLLFFVEMLKFVGHLQDVEIVEDGAKHTLVLYNCKVPQTGELVFTAANAKCSANLKVKGELPRTALSLSAAGNPNTAENVTCNSHLQSLNHGVNAITLQRTPRCGVTSLSGPIAAS